MNVRAHLGPILALALGGCMVAYYFREQVLQLLQSPWVLWAGVAIIGVGVAWGLIAISKSRIPGELAFWMGLTSTPVSWQEEFQLAREKMRYTWQSSRKSALGLKLGEVVTGSTEGAQLFSESPRVRSDWAQEFERLASLFLQESPCARVVLILDELDKLPTAESALQVMNDVKDLMHVPGVHFVASVSDEAMADFALRSMPLRNAVDSTFDEVIRVSGLACEEAVALIESRVGVFPRPLALFCYAWSGGNARDLIRNARNVARVPVHAQGTLSAVAEHVLMTDVEAAAAAYIKRSGLSGILSEHGRSRLHEALDASEGPNIRELRDLFSGIESELSLRGDVRHFEAMLSCALDIADEFSSTMDIANWARDDVGGSLVEACSAFARRLDDIRLAWPRSSAHESPAEFTWSSAGHAQRKGPFTSGGRP